MKKRISFLSFRNEILNDFKEKPCWGGNKYLGSMLYMDFGKKITAVSKKTGDRIEIGESKISIYDCYWKLKSDINSDIVKNRNFIKENFIDYFLIDIKNKNKFVYFYFSNDDFLCLDATNINEAEDEIACVTLSDGREYEISPKGYFYIRSTLSELHKNPH